MYSCVGLSKRGHGTVFEFTAEKAGRVDKIRQTEEHESAHRLI